MLAILDLLSSILNVICVEVKPASITVTVNLSLSSSGGVPLSRAVTVMPEYVPASVKPGAIRIVPVPLPLANLFSSSWRASDHERLLFLPSDGSPRITNNQIIRSARASLSVRYGPPVMVI